MKKDILKIKGVLNVEKQRDEYTIKIEDESVTRKVFKALSKCDNIVKFVVEEPSLNEIFIDKVGESYEK